MARRPRTISTTGTPQDIQDPTQENQISESGDESKENEVTEETTQIEPTAVETETAEVVEEAPTSVLEDREDDNQNLTDMRAIMRDFVKANTKLGTDADDFKQSAQLVAALTRLVVNRPHVDVLDTFLAFFKENPKGVCNETEYMKGVHTLNPKDINLIGALYALFNDLNKEIHIKVSNGPLLQLFGKPQILNYFNRKASVNLANKQAAESEY